MKYAWFLIIVFFITTTCDAKTIYKVIAADGSVTYTDQPVADSEPVSLGNLNTAAPLATPKPFAIPEVKSTTQYELAILSPSPDATVRNNLGEVSISASIQPLATGLYQLNMDGDIISTNTSGIFQLKDLQRGAHQIQISFTDNTGKILASSDQQTFYMHKASALINSN